MPTWEDCKVAKFRRVSFNSIGETRSTKSLELIHYEVFGPFTTKLNAGARYFFNLLEDDYSKKVVVCHLSRKMKFLKTSNGRKNHTHL